MMKTTALAFGVLLFSTNAQAGQVAAHWDITQEKSTIGWSVAYGGKTVSGKFPDFNADIFFDPEYVDSSHGTVKIEIARVESSDSDAQENLPGSDWFAAARYPQAVFTAEKFTHIKDDNYEAQGTLAIRDKSAKVTLPFIVKITGDKDAKPPARTAVVDGETTLKRTVFGVGQGDWSQTDSIADDVKVKIHLEAKQSP